MATLKLRAIMSAGEAVGDAVFAWCRDALGVTVNEMFGQTEMNYIVGNSHDAVAGAAGQHGPAVSGPSRRRDRRRRARVPRGEARRRGRCTGTTSHGDARPGVLPRLLEEPGGDTRASSPATWCRTGDIAMRDDDGYLWYQGRADDVFKAAGYRIGPSEIENCLVKHPAVANAAVVPKPDAERGSVVKAFVVLAAGPSAGADALVEELQQHVRGKLAPYEYPKEIEFIDACR